MKSALLIKNKYGRIVSLKSHMISIFFLKRKFALKYNVFKATYSLNITSVMLDAIYIFYTYLVKNSNIRENQRVLYICAVVHYKNVNF